MKDDTIKQQLDQSEKVDPEKVLNEILSDYCKPSFGSMSKHDIDLLMFKAMVSVRILEEEPTIYDVMKELKVTRSKARNLIYEYQLRKVEGESELKKQLYELLKKPLLSATSEVVYLEVDNPYLIDYIRNELKQLKCVTDGSFYAELIKMSNEAFCKLYESVMSEEEKNAITNKLVDLGVKPDTSLCVIMPKLMIGVAKKVAGSMADKAGEEIFSQCIEYLKDHTDTMKEAWGDLFKRETT